MAEIQDLPRWVWDLLADLIVEDDAHPKLYSKPAGTSVFEGYDWCPNVVLEKIPPGVLSAARVIAEYRSRVAQDDPEGQR